MTSPHTQTAQLCKRHSENALLDHDTTSGLQCTVVERDNAIVSLMLTGEVLDFG